MKFPSVSNTSSSLMVERLSTMFNKLVNQIISRYVLYIGVADNNSKRKLSAYLLMCINIADVFLLILLL